MKEPGFMTGFFHFNPSFFNTITLLKSFAHLPFNKYLCAGFKTQ
jgi:hypothetical protein